MSKIEPPVEGWRGPGMPDDPDALLRAFFRAEMPHPWPHLTPPDYAASSPSLNGAGRARPTAFGKRPGWLPALRTGVRSRLALAATVGLLLLGTLLLSDRFHGAAPSGGETGPELAKPIDDFIIKESLLQEVDEKPGPDGKTVKQDQPTKVLIEFYEPERR